MSYQVIARRWRSKSFDELVGQNHVSRTLLNALRSNRLPHALLFSGPRGVGKTSSARILAKSLRCPNAQDFVPCNECKSCLDIAAGSSLDIIEIDGASNNGVDSIRELRETVGYMPSSGRYKVYIIDEVHMLSQSAFNALLKTLEEPPAHVVFVLATTEPQKIPITILSRCQRFDFRKIPTRQISDHLARICEADKFEFESEALWLIARQAEGSMRDAQSLLDQVITYCEGRLTAAHVAESLGLADRVLLRDSLAALVGRDHDTLLKILEKLFRSGFEPKVFINDLLEEFRNLLFVKIGSASSDARSLIDLPDAEIEFLQNLANQLSEEDIHLLFDMTLKGGADIPKSQTPHLVLEMTLLRMASAPRVQSLMSLFAGAVPTSISSQPQRTAPVASTALAAQSPKKAPAANPTAPQAHAVPPHSQVQSAAPVAPQPAALASQAATRASFDSKITPAQNWLHFVNHMKHAAPILCAKIEQAFVISLVDKHLVLGIKRHSSFIVDQLMEPKTREDLQKRLIAEWGEGYTITIQESDQGQHLSPKATEEKKIHDTQKSIQEEVENHPLIKKAKDVFKTEIREIKETT